MFSSWAVAIGKKRMSKLERVPHPVTVTCFFLYKHCLHTNWFALFVWNWTPSYIFIVSYIQLKLFYKIRMPSAAGSFAYAPDQIQLQTQFRKFLIHEQFRKFLIQKKIFQERERKYSL